MVALGSLFYHKLKKEGYASVASKYEKVMWIINSDYKDTVG